MKDNKILNLLGVLCSFITMLITLILFLPGYILSIPIIVPIHFISKYKAREAKVNSTVKLTGSDVIGTWKVITGGILIPSFIIIYSIILMIIFGDKYGYFEVIFISLIFLIVYFVITVFLFGIY